MTDTRFKPGQSGNPKGRTPGTTPAAKLRKAIEKDAPAIIQSLIAQAKDGDVQAAKTLLDRVCPPLKSQALPVAIETGATLSSTADRIIEETLAGRVPPDVGSQLITALANQAKIVEIDDLTKRIEALEKNQ